jgi:hypothetical protein
MASLYNRATSRVILETGLNIMEKLESVLEDTLLKNITLKEIDRLSKRIID